MDEAIPVTEFSFVSLLMTLTCPAGSDFGGVLLLLLLVDRGAVPRP